MYQVRYLPERKVIYGANVEDAKSLSSKTPGELPGGNRTSQLLQKKYGFVLDASWIKQDGFVKTAEYIGVFDDRIK